MPLIVSYSEAAPYIRRSIITVIDTYRTSRTVSTRREAYFKREGLMLALRILLRSGNASSQPAGIADRETISDQTIKYARMTLGPSEWGALGFEEKSTTDISQLGIAGLTEDEAARLLADGEPAAPPPYIKQQLNALGNGMRHAFTFPSGGLEPYLVQLNSCVAHNGVHHFAVVGEGKTLIISETGRDCLRESGLIP